MSMVNHPPKRRGCCDTVVRTGWYGTYLYLTYFWSTSHLFPCVPIFPHPPILQSVMFCGSARTELKM